MGASILLFAERLPRHTTVAFGWRKVKSIDTNNVGDDIDEIDQCVLCHGAGGDGDDDDDDDENDDFNGALRRKIKLIKLINWIQLRCGFRRRMSSH